MIDFNALIKLMDLNTVLTSFCWITVAIFTVGQKFAPKGKKPWSILLSFIGREINAEIIQSQQELSKRIDDVSKELVKTQESIAEAKESINETKNFTYETRAIAARVRILRFNDEIIGGQVHSRESFIQIFEDMDNYDRYCRKHLDFKNGKTVSAKKLIQEAYEERARKNDFSY